MLDMKLEEIQKELIRIKKSFSSHPNWQEARKAYQILLDNRDSYSEEYNDFAGYSENLIRIKNSILMLDRTAAEHQFSLGISSMCDIISREIGSVVDNL